jgi:molecular chaperone HscB
VNHFEVLGVPAEFGVDLKQLKANYLRLMMTAHPDRRHPAATPDRTSLEADSDGLLLGGDAEEGDGFASVVTEAFDALQRPHTRALHLLELHGRPLDESSSQAGLAGGAFLLGIMQQREAIAEATDPGALRDMYRGNRRAMQDACDRLRDAFDALDIEKALELTAQLQYWNRIEETLRDRLDTLE